MVALADLISQHPAQADVVDLAVVVVDLEVTEAVAEDSAEDAVDLEVVVVVLVIEAVVVALTLLRKDQFKLTLEQRLLSELLCIDGAQV